MAEMPENNRHEALRQLLLLSGRPLPRFIIAGDRVAQDCAQLEALGGAATGVAISDHALAEARHEYPAGVFVCGPLQDPPLDADTFDVAFVSNAFSAVPADQLAEALRGMHRAMRPGGLLAIEAAATAAWNRPQLEAALDKLDFTFARELPGTETRILVFRREY